MKSSINGCSYTELWVNPTNWKTSTSMKALDNGYVEYYFFDPDHAEKYPKGKSVRARFKKRLKHFNSVHEKRAAIEFFTQVLEKDLNSGWNPVRGHFMATIGAVVPVVKGKDIDPKEMPLNESLDLAFSCKEYVKETKNDVASSLKYFKYSATMLNYGSMPIQAVKKLHVKAIMDNIVNAKNDLAKIEGAKSKNIRPGLSDKRYNKIIDYIRPLFDELEDNEMIDGNPFAKIKKKKIILEPRKTMSLKERSDVWHHLHDNYPTFWLFTVLFFHSGGRVIEMLDLKHEDIDIIGLRYKAIVRKGGLYTVVYRPIKKIAVKFWQMALKEAKPGEYLFSEGLIPGPRKILRRQITHRWKVHVKDKLGIEADFYSMKHSNLDELAASYGIEAAARAAGHRTTEMVVKHYAIGQHDRELELVVNASNDFF